MDAADHASIMTERFLPKMSCLAAGEAGGANLIFIMIFYEQRHPSRKGIENSYPATYSERKRVKVRATGKERSIDERQTQHNRDSLKWAFVIH